MSTNQTSTSLCQLNIDKCLYDVVDSSLVAPVVSLVLYGGYLVLFGACICVLRRKRDSQPCNCIIIAALFIVASCGLGFNVAAFFTKARFHLVYGSTPVTLYGGEMSFSKTNPGDDKFVALFNTGRRLQRATQICTILANILTDGILLWRCFLVWNRRRGIVFPLLFLCALNNVIGIVNVALLPRSQAPSRESFSPISTGENFFSISFGRSDTGEKLSKDSILLITYAIGSTVTNVILTLLIAGRIFSITRKVAGFSTIYSRNMYRVVISATLESGLLYPIVLILYVILMMLNTTMGRQASGMEAGQLHVWRVNLGAEVIYSMIIPVMGIASTLIIVRAALGLSIKDEETLRETILSDFRVAVVTTTNERNVIDMLPAGSEDTHYMESVEAISTVDLESQHEKKSGYPTTAP